LVNLTALAARREHNLSTSTTSGRRFRGSVALPFRRAAFKALDSPTSCDLPRTIGVDAWALCLSSKNGTP